MRKNRFTFRLRISPIAVLRVLGPCALLVLILFLANRQLGPVPPLGPLLNPFTGIWVAPDDQLRYMDEEGLRAGLHGALTIRYDQQRIPHIFAENDEDLYFAQGFVVAADRLWQMEFIARAASGRLAEILGPRALEYDKMFVKLGLPEAAAETTEYLSHDDLSWMAVEAFARGVNAYIATITAQTLPFEYKLLNHRPEPWTPLKSALLLKFMAYNLSFWPNDLLLSRSHTRVTEEDFQKLFPLSLEISESIIPADKKWDFTSMAPEPPAQLYQAPMERLEPLPTPHPGNGSNNWAVAARKSKTGAPIVSNDVHLGYNMPALWYQLQLQSPKQNVYGVTIPGAPGVVLGFNSRVAWATTNGGSDIVDWYDLHFRDENRDQYLFDGKWRPVISKDHWIKVRGQEPVHIVLRKTHFGPIVYDHTEAPLNPLIPRGLAMRWGALDPSNELKTFLLLNRATDFAKCRAAIEEYSSPDQNFICADQSNIGIFHEGLYPVRWRGQGRMISDGSDPKYEWRRWLPRDEVPFIINPARGFVSSANQMPVSQKYPHYLGWPFEVPYRGARINELLSATAKFAPEDFIQMQHDSLLLPARELVGEFLRRLPRTDLSLAEKKAVEALAAWDFRMLRDSAAAVIFDEWFRQLQQAIWSDQFPDSKQFFVPRANQTAQMILNEPEAKWFDRIDTDTHETLADLLRSTLRTSIEKLVVTLGPDPAIWKWGDFQPAVFPHYGRIPGLGSDAIGTDGHAFSIFANRGNHGPVWKSVVALGPDLRAWGIYPGGQSGHPASRYYETFLAEWADGRMRPLEYTREAATPLKGELRVIQLTPRREGSAK